MEKPKVIVICGPTASGKTKLSVELAKKIDGEIICCDSMQIYKDMNIKYEDITAIMHVVCYADVLLDSKIKELEQRGFNNVADKYRPKKEEIKKGM